MTNKSMVVVVFTMGNAQHIYVQDMLTLYEHQPGENQLFKEYMDFRYFSVNRSSKRRAGLWSNMAITIH